MVGVTRAAEPEPEGNKEAIGRVQGKHIALTYSCPTDVEVNPLDVCDLTTIADMLESCNVGTPRVSALVLSKEQHTNGKHHYHAYLGYTSKLNVRNMRTWDLKGVHPNIKIAGDWKGWVRYVIKDGNYIVRNVDIDDIMTPSKAEKSKAWEMALKVVRETGNPKDGADILSRLQPQQWVLNSARIMATLVSEATQAQMARNPLKIKTTNWVKLVEDVDITLKNDASDDYTPVTILTGSTGIGKTEAAKYLLKRTYGDACRILFVNHAEDFKGKEGLYDAFVWDEANFNSSVANTPWSREQQIAICGHDSHVRTILARYSNVIIPPNIPRIFTCNYLNRCVDMEDPAIARRCQVVDCGSKLLYKKA